MTRWLVGIFGLLLVGCGTLAEGDGGGDNLPSRGIVPFTPLSRGDDPDVASLPLVVADDATLLDEPCAVVTGNRVDLYLQASDEVSTSIRRATSTGGVAFGEPVVVLSPQLDWEENWVGAPSVLAEGSEIMLWYVGGVSQPAIGLATSVDGVHFDRRADPVLSPQVGERIGSPSVVRLDQGYALFYSLADDEDAQEQPATVIARADSSDGLAWIRQGTVLGRGEGCTSAQGGAVDCWDAGYVTTPGARATRSPTGRWQIDLWYAGGSSSDSDIGFAGSFEGVMFSRYRLNPVLGTPEPERACSVITRNDTELMYYVTRSMDQQGIALAWDRP